MGFNKKDIIDWLVGRANKNYSTPVKVLTTLLDATVFLAVMPALIFLAGRFFGGGLVLTPLAALLFSLVCLITGLIWMYASVSWQLIYGKGTPVPTIPTKNFLQNGPYQYVRNPMMLGFFLYFLGWAFIVNHYGSFLAVGLIIILLLNYMKFIEEIELEKRFGQAYRDYKKEIPFIIPRWHKK